MEIILAAAEALEAIGAIEDSLCPGRMIQIPLDGLAKERLEIRPRRPTEFGARAAGVDSIPLIVTGAVGHKGDRGAMRLAVDPRTQLVEQAAEGLHELKVATFVVATETIGPASDALLGRQE